mmetsp:Transcript_79020/g.137007  ORF Transcript_79020/g.137007 Transcript_79020/m.137007 type:complete len:212 (-) Transcript_79020:837-1472(-)
MRRLRGLKLNVNRLGDASCHGSGVAKSVFTVISDDVKSDGGTASCSSANDGGSDPRYLHNASSFNSSPCLRSVPSSACASAISTSRRALPASASAARSTLSTARSCRSVTSAVHSLASACSCGIEALSSASRLNSKISKGKSLPEGLSVAAPLLGRALSTSERNWQTSKRARLASSTSTLRHRSAASRRLSKPAFNAAASASAPRFAARSR